LMHPAIFASRRLRNFPKPPLRNSCPGRRSGTEYLAGLSRRSPRQCRTGSGICCPRIRRPQRGNKCCRTASPRPGTCTFLRRKSGRTGSTDRCNISCRIRSILCRTYSPHRSIGRCLGRGRLAPRLGSTCHPSGTWSSTSPRDSRGRRRR
jgi:hypothetical protein